MLAIASPTDCFCGNCYPAGGLLNASFGNATEVIIAGFALKNGYVRIVQLTLYGSVVSNLLLVMGSAFLIGGTKHKHQYFNIKVRGCRATSSGPALGWSGGFWLLVGMKCA